MSSGSFSMNEKRDAVVAPAPSTSFYKTNVEPPSPISHDPNAIMRFNPHEMDNFEYSPQPMKNDGKQRHKLATSESEGFSLADIGMDKEPSATAHDGVDDTIEFREDIGLDISSLLQEPDESIISQHESMRRQSLGGEDSDLLAFQKSVSATASASASRTHSPRSRRSSIGSIGLFGNQHTHQDVEDDNADEIFPFNTSRTVSRRSSLIMRLNEAEELRTITSSPMTHHQDGGGDAVEDGEEQHLVGWVESKAVTAQPVVTTDTLRVVSKFNLKNHQEHTNSLFRTPEAARKSLQARQQQGPLSPPRAWLGKNMTREEQRLTEQLTEFSTTAYKGQQFLKHGRWGKPHKVQVILTAGEGRLTTLRAYWGSGKKYVVLSKANGAYLLTGKQTSNFTRSVSSKAENDCCFSIVIPHQRTLDLEARNREQRDVWVQGIGIYLMLLEDPEV